MDGAYKMTVKQATAREDNLPIPVINLVLGKWSGYEILGPWTFHSVVPLTVTHTVMLNGQPFAPDVAHTAVRRTGGKDLDKMPEDELLAHLALFQRLVEEYGQGAIRETV